jgi:Nitronate monooxygenase
MVGMDQSSNTLAPQLTRVYGIQHPFVGAGMGFVAHEHLAAAVTNAGGLGFLGATTLGVAAAILAESTLSFLGLGFPPDSPTWGRLLLDAKDRLSGSGPLLRRRWIAGR